MPRVCTEKMNREDEPSHENTVIRNHLNRNYIVMLRAVTLKSIVAFLLLALTFLAMVSRYWALTIDDAYISARYAWNAAHGAGLVFNPTDHVMGYTNLLLVLIETAVYSWGGDGIVAAKSVGVVAALTLLGLTYALAYQLDAKRWRSVGTIAVVSLILFPELALGAVIGLESALFAAFFTASIWIFVRWIWHGDGGYLAQGILAVTLLCTTLTRPEGLGLAFFLFGAHLAITWHSQRHAPPPLGKVARSLLWLPCYLLLLLPVLLWLNSYYGSPIPNTFFAKTSAGVAWEKYRVGIGYIARWISATGVFWILPASLLPFFLRQVSTTMRLFGLLVLWWLAYVTYTGGDWIQGFRFMLPILPLLYLLGASGIVQIWEAFKSSLNHLTLTSQKLLAILLLSAIWLPAGTALRDNQEEAMAWANGYSAAHHMIGSWLAAETPLTTTVALMDVGIIGFVS